MGTGVTERRIETAGSTRMEEEEEEEEELTVRAGTQTDGVAGRLVAKQVTRRCAAAEGARREEGVGTGRVGAGTWGTATSSTKDGVGTPTERVERVAKATRGAALRTAGSRGGAGIKAGAQPGA